MSDLKKLLNGVCMNTEKHGREILTSETYQFLKRRLSPEELYVIELYYIHNKTLTQTAQMAVIRRDRAYEIIDNALELLEEDIRKRIE